MLDLCFFADSFEEITYQKKVVSSFLDPLAKLTIIHIFHCKINRLNLEALPIRFY